MSKISVTYKKYIWGQLNRQVLKNGILRTGICTACMNGNILSSCALLNFLKPSIQLLTWIFPPKTIQKYLRWLLRQENFILQEMICGKSHFYIAAKCKNQFSSQYFHKHIIFKGKTNIFLLFYTYVPYKTE
jgi:hypothetical protein